MIGYRETIKNELAECILKTPYIRHNGLKIKWLEGLDIIVRVNQNLYEKEFLNRDICLVLAEQENGNLLIQRLTDKHESFVEKKYLNYPEWSKYDL